MRLMIVSIVFWLTPLIFGGCAEYSEYETQKPSMDDTKEVTVLPKHQEEFDLLSSTVSGYHKLSLPKIDAEHAHAHSRIGIIHFESGNLTEARFNLERSIEMYRDSAITHFYLGRVLSKEEVVGRAIEEFKVTLRLDPEMAEAHKYLSGLYQQSGLENKAKLEFQKYEEANSKKRTDP